MFISSLWKYINFIKKIKDKKLVAQGKNYKYEDFSFNMEETFKVST